MPNVLLVKSIFFFAVLSSCSTVNPLKNYYFSAQPYTGDSSDVEGTRIARNCPRTEVTITRSLYSDARSSGLDLRLLKGVVAGFSPHVNFKKLAKGVKFRLIFNTDDAPVLTAVHFIGVFDEYFLLAHPSGDSQLFEVDSRKNLIPVASGFSSPLDRFSLYKGFGERRHKPKWHIHCALDIPGTDGENVRAVLEAKVIDALNRNNRTGYGTKVILEHSVFIDGRPAKLISTYAHLKFNSITVRKGSYVKSGDVIGKLGNTGFTYSKKGGKGHHLHLETKYPCNRFEGDIPCVSSEPVCEGKKRAFLDLSSYFLGETSSVKIETVSPALTELATSIYKNCQG